MTNSHDQKEKLKEYQARYHFWSDKRVSQLSFQNNIFLTISLAIMGYCWKERSSVYTELLIDTRLKVEWKIVLFFIGMIFLSYSIITGLLLTITRLYDLRLTSNILLTRKRALQRNVSVKDENILRNCICKSVYSLWVVFIAYNELELYRDEIKTDNSLLQKRFTNARQLSRDLGRCSWWLMTNQTVSLVTSIFFFMTVLIMK